jgi:hypothetical protein
MGGFSLDVLRESDVPSLPIWRIFYVLIPRFLVVLTVIFGPILAQILHFYNFMNTFNTAVKTLLT